MVNAYSTIANNGLRHEPVLVTHIYNSDNELIYEGPKDAPRALPYKSAFLMQQMLMYGVKEGTSRGLLSYLGYWNKTDLGGKTGTSNNASDGWFIGVTPNLVCGAWVGGEYRQIHFRTARLGQGAYTALPICGKFLASVLKDKEMEKYRGRFEVPAGEGVNLDLFICAPKVSSKPKVVESDSTSLDDELTEYDIDGNPIPKNKPQRPEEEGEIYLPEKKLEFIIEE